MHAIRPALTAAILFASAAPCAADPAPRIHYAPAENLEKIDVALIDGARREIDLAAYVLTDWPVILALTRAANRGVKLRLYLDGAQLANRPPRDVFQDLAATPTVQIRIKPLNKRPMHLKSYQIDRRLLRTGAANLSASGLKQQDNDLIVIKGLEASMNFKRHFEAIWAKGEAWK
ncbi:phospholipase D-like domain-containing protein [Methylocapsa aurea]|uniref:phospholipase D-like domain-containing protein n=1 Tax=Methylocapsa aurea TaxID=663610 RepID=UPI00056CB650|nr:phospholipase D-like domain-containing protein [Methylocapsa aurea]